MSITPVPSKHRWVVHCDPETIEAVKTLAASSHQSVGSVLDLVVEYFSRKIEFADDNPLKWQMPDDF